MALSLSRWVKKVAVVTGAGSGIGAAISKKLVDEGVTVRQSFKEILASGKIKNLAVAVVGLDRTDQLEENSKKQIDKKGKLFVVRADVCQEDSILKAFKWTVDNVGPVNILVNCAGITYKNNLVDGETEKWKKLLDTNVLGLCITSREAIKIMRENNIDGHIININSILGHKVADVGAVNVYPASKYAVTALTETLRLELKNLKSNIKVTSISPGNVNTPIFPESLRQTNFFKRNVANYLLKPEDIANAVVFALSTPPHVQIQELTITHVNEQF